MVARCWQRTVFATMLSEQEPTMWLLKQAGTVDGVTTVSFSVEQLLLTVNNGC